MTIYEPAEDSYLLAEQVKKYAFGKVLDVGTGSGIQAITASKLKQVKSVLAVDINKEAVDFVKGKSLKKIKTVKSDLFSKVKSKFDTIIFNPPYLPFDHREPEDSRLATTGGKHGYELLQRFLLELNDHLTKDGIALILFSSLTNKEQVENFIEDICFESENLSEQKISFETLYVYKIKRSTLLNELIKKKIKNIKKLAFGKRGIVYQGVLNKNKIAIKTKKRNVKTETINKEANLLIKLNKNDIGPKLYFAGNNYFACEFAEGKTIEEYFKSCSKTGAKKVILNVLNQCRTLDNLKISKEEMTNPYKHVIVGKKVYLIDFERVHYDMTPGNVTQFCQYIMKNDWILSKKGIHLDKQEIINSAREYKNNPTESNYNKIKKLVTSC